MSFGDMKIGEYYNVENAIDLASVCEELANKVRLFKSDLFMDYANMRDLMNNDEKSRRIWSIRETGTWYVDVETYHEISRADGDWNSVLRYLVETNNEGVMTITRIA